MQQLFAVLVPEVVLQLQVSQSTDQDLVAFEVHPADLTRRFQQSLQIDNYYEANQQQKPPGHEFTLGPNMLSSMESISPSGLVVMVFVVQNGSQLGAGRQW